MNVKKITSAVLSAGIMISVLPCSIPAYADESTEILENTGFEALADDNVPFWWSTTAGEASLDSPEAAITAADMSYAGNSSAYISGRNSANAGVMQRYQLDRLTGADEYEATAYVRYTGDDAPDSIVFTLVFGNNYGWDQYEIASETVKKDRWTEIKGHFTAPADITDGYVYIKTDETDNFTDYYVDNFSLISDPFVIEEGDFIVNGSFDETSDPWFGFGGCTVECIDGVLRSSDRGFAWEGLGQTLDKKLRSGHRYKISADVKYDGAADSNCGINLTLLHESGEAGAAAQYATLMTSTVKGGEWTHTEQLVTLPEGILDDQTIYFGTATDEQTGDIYIDNVSITEVADDGALAKTVGNSNPLMSQCFGADPFAMEYDGRLYVYMSSDKYEYDQDGNILNNSFAEIKSIKVISTEDMVNWTDHGEIPVGGAESSSANTYYEGLPNGGAKWAGLSWAPAAAHKTINGEEKFFLYFANAGGGIGVLEGDSPIGPFHDPTVDEEHPYGTSIVDIWQEIPGTEKVVTYYDPAVFVDDDGQGYLYFGGGFTDDYNHPESVCVIKLSDDMTSTVGDAVPIDAPGLFEDSGIHKYNGKYYYSYSSNFESGMDVVEPGVIYYLVSDDPMGPFVSPVDGEPAGKVLDNMYMFFKTGGNNHHTIFEFKGQDYIVYHAETLGLAISGDTSELYGYRSPHINKLEYDENDVIKPVIADYKGVSQLMSIDPYGGLEAETIAWNSGIKTEPIEESAICECVNMKLTDLQDGDWTSISGADFGDDGANSFSVKLNSLNKGHIEIRLDSLNGELVGEIDVEPTDGYETLSCATDNITGVHDVYFVFKGEADELFDVDSWGFSKDSIGTDDPDIPDELTVSASTQRIDGDVCVTVTANDDISEKCVFTALYDENDVLIKCMSVPTAGMTDNTAYVIMSDSGSAEYAKVFVWDTISGMQPTAKSAKANIE